VRSFMQRRDRDAAASHGVRCSRLRTVELCHAPPREVRTPRSFNACADPAKFGLPPLRRASHHEWVCHTPYPSTPSATDSRWEFTRLQAVQP
jgi:hypothetical protein